MSSLPEENREILHEAFNLGLGAAAGSISELVRKEINMTEPVADYMTLESIIQMVELNEGNEVTMIQQDFNGFVKGTASLIYEQSASHELISTLLGIESGTSKVTKLFKEPLVEIGNIVLNSCLKELSKMVGAPLTLGFPRLRWGNTRNLFTQKGQLGTNQGVFSVKMGFAITRSRGQGEMHCIIQPDDPIVLRDFLTSSYRKLVGA